MRLLRHEVPRNDRGGHCEPVSYCHCERSVAIPVGHEIASALALLAMTGGGHCEPFFIVIASRRRGNLNKAKVKNQRAKMKKQSV